MWIESKKYFLCPRYKKVKFRWNSLEYIKSELQNFTGLSAIDDNSEKLIKNAIRKDAVRVFNPTLIYELPELRMNLLSISNHRIISMYYVDKFSNNIKNDRICRKE